ncbi:phosphotransferase family protein [Oceanobacillus oncorhynchi subsp. oncorhynchi]|uniref:phosphotransferase family protein n=1 Tax=Oceanobacillus oncorhynchi TaxID=545501 RepID=UPI003641ABC9
MIDKYIKNIQQIYPDLSMGHYYRNDIGQNNDVLVVNSSLVFGFPNYEKGITQLKKETEFLEYIKDFITIPIPHPTYQSFRTLKPGEVFTGYKMIAGVPLWRESLQKIENEELLKELASQLVTFLTELHSISKEKANIVLKLSDSSPLEEMSNLFTRIQHKLFPFMRKEAQEEITHSFETFLKEKSASSIESTLIHGDFGASNILWDLESGKLSGVIDFGGAGPGDPAYDFAGILSSYGADFFDRCIDLYPGGNAISERVKFYRSTFALQEALHGIENNDNQAFENGIKEYR